MSGIGTGLWLTDEARLRTIALFAIIQRPSIYACIMGIETWKAGVFSVLVVALTHSYRRGRQKVA
jgi:hypothetical protein